MASQQDFDALAERIRLGIATVGSCFIDRHDLEILWPEGNIPSDEEKRVIVKNFAAQYGFTVDLGPSLLVAVFQNPI